MNNFRFHFDGINYACVPVAARDLLFTLYQRRHKLKASLNYAWNLLFIDLYRIDCLISLQNYSKFDLPTWFLCWKALAILRYTTLCSWLTWNFSTWLFYFDISFLMHLTDIDIRSVFVSLIVNSVFNMGFKPHFYCVFFEVAKNIWNFYLQLMWMREKNEGGTWILKAFIKIS